MSEELVAIIVAGLLGGGGAHVAGRGINAGLQKELRHIRDELGKVRERLAKLEALVESRN